MIFGWFLIRPDPDHWDGSGCLKWNGSGAATLLKAFSFRNLTTSVRYKATIISKLPLDTSYKNIYIINGISQVLIPDKRWGHAPPAPHRPAPSGLDRSYHFEVYLFILKQERHISKAFLPFLQFSIISHPPGPCILKSLFIKSFF